ncbi:MAG: glycosyltransferase, partial [Moraxellaceae bacterium]
ALDIEEKIISLNCSSFDSFLIELQPDAVLFDRFFTEEQFGWRVEKTCPHALRILDTEDLHCLRNARHILLKRIQQDKSDEQTRQSVDPIVASEQQLYDVMVSDDMTQREVASIFRCDISLMISDYEINLLRDYFFVPQDLLFYFPLTASSSLTESTHNFSERSHFIAIGNFRHEPNWDAVLYLKHAIWPRIFEGVKKATGENVELHIYGAYPPPKATQLHQPKNGFLVKGWVESATQVMCGSRVCLAPLRFGAGIKGKLLEAMMCGTPSVTTTVGAEAMCKTLPWGGAIENSAQEIADAAVALYCDETRWKVAQSEGFAILTQNFSSGEHADLFVGRLEELRENIADARRKNFVGAMLRHHTMKSTQYMSQWIESK